MSEQSAKPYLIRAICEWCGDNALTPYLAVKVNEQTRVPAAFVKNGEIVLNVSTTATRKLTIDNEWIQFTARFNGASQEVAVPINAVSGIFAKETGYGFASTLRRTPPRRSYRQPHRAIPRSRPRPRTATVPSASARRICRSSNSGAVTRNTAGIAQR
jgi:stringent starvation protein B